MYCLQTLYKTGPLLALTIAALVLSACISNAFLDGKPNPDYFAEDFLDTLLVSRSDIPGAAGVSKYVNRWEVMPRIAVIGNPSEQEMNWIQNAIGLYAKISGRTIRLAQPDDTVNYVIAFVDPVPPTQVASALQLGGMEIINSNTKINYVTRALLGLKGHPPAGERDYGPELNKYFQQIVKARYDYGRDYYPDGTKNPYTRTYCMFFPAFVANGDHAEDGAVILIGRNYYKMQRCIYEETLQSLGLFHDTTKTWPSIMSFGTAYSENKLPSNYDLLYLRILYDQKMSAKITREMARPIARDLFTQYFRSGALEELAIMQ